MKWSLGISHFLDEISSLSHSIVFLYFFALIAEKGFRISHCYSLELCIQMGISQIQRGLTISQQALVLHTNLNLWVFKSLTVTPISAEEDEPIDSQGQKNIGA